MFNIKRTLKFLVLVLFLVGAFSDSTIFAQISLPDDGLINDAPGAPIGQFIGVAIAIGSYLGYNKLKKEE